MKFRGEEYKHMHFQEAYMENKPLQNFEFFVSLRDIPHLWVMFSLQHIVWGFNIFFVVRYILIKQLILE